MDTLVEIHLETAVNILYDINYSFFQNTICFKLTESTSKTEAITTRHYSMYTQIYLEVQSNPTYPNSYKKGILLMALSYSVQNHSIPIAVVARWAQD